MPELPEVETIVNELCDSNLIGRKIVDVQIFWPRTIATPDFADQIKGQTIKHIERRGKYLVFSLSRHTLFVHLRMTGKFLLGGKKTELLLHERVRLQFDDGRILHYQDQRKFGKWSLLLNPQDIFGKLGLEPLSDQFTLSAFEQLLKTHPTKAKPFLLNQRYVAGLGNIYVDEALWHAKIHPLQPVNTLSKQKIEALHAAIPKVLLLGIAYKGTSLGSKQNNYFSVNGRRGENIHNLSVFRRDGLPCPRCQHTLIKTIVAQRGTHLCPHCQTLKGV